MRWVFLDFLGVWLSCSPIRPDDGGQLGEVTEDRVVRIERGAGVAGSQLSLSSRSM
uniref:Uncharacterized protein n=1 Tax=Arundo donax TaxID=35708 RepID=A0A0A8XXW7_ARUDO